MLTTFVGGVAAVCVATWMGAPSRTVVVAPSELSGDAPRTVAEDLTQASTLGVQDAGASPKEMPQGCTRQACASEVAGADGYVLRATVELRDSDYTMALVLTDHGGAVVDERTQACEICTHREAAKALRSMVQAAVEAVAEHEGPVLVAFPSAVAGAPPGGAASRRDSPMKPAVIRGLGWAGAGVGAGSVIAGVALLVLNERPVQRDCEGDNVDADGDCAFRYNTLGGGAGLAIGGALALGVGVGLLVLHRQRKPSKRAVNVEVTATSAGLRMRF